MSFSALLAFPEIQKGDKRPDWFSPGGRFLLKAPCKREGRESEHRAVGRLLHPPAQALAPTTHFSSLATGHPRIPPRGARAHQKPCTSTANPASESARQPSLFSARSARAPCNCGGEVQTESDRPTGDGRGGKKTTSPCLETRHSFHPSQLLFLPQRPLFRSGANNPTSGERRGRRLANTCLKR